jgi:hypothetical protein
MGFNAFGLLIRRPGVNPLTEGVDGKALNRGSPGGFAAFGYVPK